MKKYQKKLDESELLLDLHFSLVWREQTQLYQIEKTRQKLDLKNSWNWRIIRYAWNSLTNFEYEWLYEMTGNRNHVNLQKIDC